MLREALIITGIAGATVCGVGAAVEHSKYQGIKDRFDQLSPLQQPTFDSLPEMHDHERERNELALLTVLSIGLSAGSVMYPQRRPSYTIPSKYRRYF